MEAVLAGLFAPVILFFFLGLLTVLVKSDLEIPPALSTAMAIFLMTAIGLRGGAAAVQAVKAAPGILTVIVIVAVLAIICGVSFAFITANVLKKAGLSTADAWSAGGHYGAVSSATLAVAVGLATAAQEVALPGSLVFGGWMPALYPFMDTPALLTAIVFGRMALAKEGLGQERKIETKKILHTSIFGMGVWLLICSLVIGILATTFSPYEMADTMKFFYGMFRGVLALFLLDMGMIAGRRLSALKEIGSNLWKIVIVAFGLPLVWGLTGVLGVFGVNLLLPGTMGWADAFVFAALAGGCSYVTAPVAMRIAIPEANPSVTLPMALALTFPFNIVINFRIWEIVARTLWGA